MAATEQAGDRVIANRYRLLDELGRGGMGIVWRCRDLELDRVVAVKEVLLPADLDETSRAESHARVRRESRTAARLSDHGNVVTLHDVFDFDGHPWVVMQLVEGRSLAEELKQRGTLTAEELAPIAEAMLTALDAAHQAGILHRDVKPGNVLLGANGRPMLTDFGIAQLEGDASITRTGMLAGSPEYMAPERLDSSGAVGPPSDLWSLGVTLYAAATGGTPFRRDNIAATVGAVVSAPIPPPDAGWLTPVIMGLLERDPSRRLTAQSAQELMRQSAAGGTAAPPAPTQAQPSARPPAQPSAAPTGGMPAPGPPQWPAGPPAGAGTGPMPGGYAPPSSPSGGWQTLPGHGPAYTPQPAPTQAAHAAPRPRRRGRIGLTLGVLGVALVLVAGVAVTGWALLRTGSSNLTTWEDSVVRVEYPDGWDVNSSQTQFGAEFTDPDSDGVAFTAAAMTPDGYSDTEGVNDARTFLQAWEDTIAGEATSYEQRRLEPTTVEGFPDGWDAMVWDANFTASQENANTDGLTDRERFVIWWQVHDPDGNAYFIWWSGPQAERDQLQELIDSTRESFTYIGPPS